MTDTEQRAQHRLTREHYTPKPPVLADITFSDPETITVADLRAGDFIVEIPPYRNVRGQRFDSAVKTITDASFDRGWYERIGRRGRRLIASRSFTVQRAASGRWDFPVETPVVVRRQQQPEGSE